MLDFQKDLEFALMCHSGQTRKGLVRGVRLPYFVHCTDVLKIGWTCGIIDQVTGPASICHDILEECPGITEGNVRLQIGEAATNVVVELTFIPSSIDPKEVAAEKAEYLRTFAAKSPDAIAVKACDRYCNVTDFLRVDPKYAKRYFEKGLPIFAAVEERRAEIETKWGKHAANNLLSLKRSLEDRLAKHQ